MLANVVTEELIAIRPALLKQINRRIGGLRKDILDCSRSGGDYELWEFYWLLPPSGVKALFGSDRAFCCRFIDALDGLTMKLTSPKAEWLRSTAEELLVDWVITDTDLLNAILADGDYEWLYSDNRTHWTLSGATDTDRWFEPLFYAGVPV